MPIAQTLNPILDALFPPQCLGCAARVSRYGTLCAECWGGILFIAEPFCPLCGTPFDFALGEENLCGHCERKRPPFSRARSVFHYDEKSSALVTRLKYGDDTRLAAALAPWLAAAGAELVAASDAVTPVPLYYWRFVKRRYNQAALLASALSRRTGIEYMPDALIRTRPTRPQTGLEFSERQKNVKDAFAVPRRRLSAIRGKSLLLVDDVFTTGATLRACTRTLLDAGAANVSVLTLARRV